MGIMNIVWCAAPSGTATELVIYTGQECRAAKNNRQPRSKIGILPYQHNLQQLKRNLPLKLQSSQPPSPSSKIKAAEVTVKRTPKGPSKQSSYI